MTFFASMTEPGVSASEPPPAGPVPVIVPRLLPAEPVSVTETVYVAQPASMTVTVKPETL